MIKKEQRALDVVRESLRGRRHRAAALQQKVVDHGAASSQLAAVEWGGGPKWRKIMRASAACSR